MASIDRIYSVAVFNCGYTSPDVQKARGEFHEIFDALLQPALERFYAGTDVPPVRFLIRGWDTVKQQYPATLDNIDAIIVTGSPNGVYENFSWLQKLNDYLSDVYQMHPSIKIYGSCFGHQAICKALFEKAGAIVQKNPAGYELGVQSVGLTDDFMRHFPGVIESPLLRLQFLHGDHVVFPKGSLPEDVHLVGTTPRCQVQGIYQAQRLLTYQGHPEFDEFIETAFLEVIGEQVGWDPTFIENAVATAQEPDDAPTAADIMVAFFLG